MTNTLVLVALNVTAPLVS